MLGWAWAGQEYVWSVDIIVVLPALCADAAAAYNRGGALCADAAAAAPCVYGG